MGKKIQKDSDYELWWVLLQTTHLMRKAREKELRRFDSSGLQAGILYSTWILKNQATPSLLSRWLNREPHSVHAALITMEKKGIINRNKDLERKNMIRVSLTEKGIQIYKNTVKRETIHNILTDLSHAERRQLTKTTLKLRKKTLGILGIDGMPPFLSSED
jgi:MarR family transcriptional regulator, 2-MHQ and catechol-resistance regulon repressor